MSYEALSSMLYEAIEYPSVKVRVENMVYSTFGDPLGKKSPGQSYFRISYRPSILAEKMYGIKDHQVIDRIDDINLLPDIIKSVKRSLK
jgi:hypothetical protein